MGNDQKKKNREKMKKAQNAYERTKRLQQNGRQKQAKTTIKEIDKEREQLEAKVLLGSLSLEETPHKLNEARRFLDRFTTIAGGLSVFGEHLDNLFALAHGNLPTRHVGKIGAGEIDRCAVNVLKAMQSIIAYFEKNVPLLLSEPIATLLGTTDDLLNKLHDAALPYNRQIIIWHEKEVLAMEELGEEMDEPDPNNEDPRYYHFFPLVLFIGRISLSYKMIVNWQLGIPIDLYRDITELAEKGNLHTAMFFLRQIYAAMIAVERHPVLQMPHPNGMIPLQQVINHDPEKYLPDPDFLSQQKRIALRLNRLEGGEISVRILECLLKKGLHPENALSLMERLRNAQSQFKIVLEILKSCDELALSLLECCVGNSIFFLTYEKLTGIGCPALQIARFLLDYGDYHIGGHTLAEIVVRQNRRTEAMRLIVDNALAFCCGEAAETMVTLLDDLDKSTKALRHYLFFATSESPYKQLAVLRFLKHCGVQGINGFVENLHHHSDEWVGQLLHNLTDNEVLFRRVAEEFEPTTQPSIHPLKSLSSFDLIVRYGLIAEIGELAPELLVQLDLVLNGIRGTRFEANLLGQAHLRQLLVENLSNDAQLILVALSSLPVGGNPYLSLKNILSFTPTPIISIPTETRSIHDRLVLISAGVPAETISYLEIELGIPVHEINVDGNGAKFNAIKKGDVVVYNTTKTSHSVYYRAKHLAVKHGATFRHISRTNREALLEAARS